MVTRSRLLILLVALLPGAVIAQSPKIVLPPTISEVEFLRGRVTDFPLPSTSQAVVGVDVQLANGKLQVRPRLAALPVGITGTAKVDFDFDVGRLLHGSYSAELLAPDSSTPLATTSTTSTASDNAGIRDLSGHWWNPAEPGWGLMVWHRLKDNALFSAWFTYEAQGKPLWAALNFDPSPALPPPPLGQIRTHPAASAPCFHKDHRWEDPMTARCNEWASCQARPPWDFSIPQESSIRTPLFTARRKLRQQDTPFLQLVL